MNEISFPLISLGSENPRIPSLETITKWIAKNRGYPADLISYQTDALLAQQIPYVTTPAAGGEFYRKRIIEILGIRQNTIMNPPELTPSQIIADITIAKRTAKHLQWSLPSPGSLSLTDTYYRTETERQEALTDIYSEVCRTIRDQDVPRCILINAIPNEIELEKLHSRKYLWVTCSSAIEKVLEWTCDIVINSSVISRLSDLYENYSIHNVFICDANPETLCTALETIDCDHLFTAGYGAESDYWKKLSTITVPKKIIQSL